jgi:membrane protein implicated in regulation of membrane protease activity
MEMAPGDPRAAHPLGGTIPPGADEVALRGQRIQILATEHWNLLATRSLSWSESFSRASMFLTVLSGAVVALALVAQATQFGEGFVLFALLVLPVVLFVGGTTFVRLVEVNNEDVHWVYGMNRLRHAYLDMEPELGPYFVTGVSEDDAAISQTFGSHGTGSALTHALITTPATIAFVNAMVAAVLGAIALMEVQMAMESAVAVGAAVFVVASVLQIWFGRRSAGEYQREHAKRDPSGG